MDNSRIAELFEHTASLLEMKGETVFTVRAYQRAARTIQHLPQELDQMVVEERDLTQIPGIGKAISKKIKELVETGRLAYFEELKGQFPEGVMELMRIPGLGPKTIMRLWKELGITSVAELEQGIESGRVAALPRLGEKTAANMRRQLQMARARDQRVPIGRAMRVASNVERSCIRSRISSVRLRAFSQSSWMSMVFINGESAARRSGPSRSSPHRPRR